MLQGVAAQQPIRIGILCTNQQAAAANQRGSLGDYIDAVQQAGGTPLLLPISDVHPAQVLDQVDGLLIPGGADVDPQFYGQENRYANKGNANFDAYEIGIIRQAYQMNMPMIGICRGQQLMNVAANGTLIQDINHEVPRPADVAIEHNYKNIASYANDDETPYHNVRLADSLEGRTPVIKQLFGMNFLTVNSAHHQAIGQIAPILAVTAWAMDGVIEGVERKDNPTQWGVQWHPERQRKVDSAWTKMFERLVTDSRAWRYGTVVTRPEPEPEPEPAAPVAATKVKKKRTKSGATQVRAPREMDAVAYLTDQLFDHHPGR